MFVDLVDDQSRRIRLRTVQTLPDPLKMLMQVFGRQIVRDIENLENLCCSVDGCNIARTSPRKNTGYDQN